MASRRSSQAERARARLGRADVASCLAVCSRNVTSNVVGAHHPKGVFCCQQWGILVVERVKCAWWRRSAACLRETSAAPGLTP